jgi:hypothetical protein
MGTTTYEVILGPAANRTVLGMRDSNDRKELADALRLELVGGPNAGKEYRFDSAGNARPGVDPGRPAGGIYTATPLSFGGYTAVHRPMTSGELKRLRQEQHHRPAARQGFYVLDIVSPESAFARRPQLS